MGLRFASNDLGARVSPAPPSHFYVKQDNDSEFVMLIDTKGAIAGANSGALRLLGCTEEEAIGSYYGRFFKVMHFGLEAANGDRHDHDNHLDGARSAAPGRNALTVFGIAQCKDGTRFPLEASVIFGRAGDEGWDASWSGAVMASTL